MWGVQILYCPSRAENLTFCVCSDTEFKPKISLTFPFWGIVQVFFKSFVKLFELLMFFQKMFAWGGLFGDGELV